MPIKKML